MRIYLDTNVWCRPYDDLSQKRIEDESFAFEKIKNYTNDKIFEIIGSDILIAEILLIKGEYKKDLVLSGITDLSNIVVKANKRVYNYGDLLSKEIGITNLIDCYHICSAIVGKAKYFITCDDKIIKKSDKIQSFVCKKNYELVILNVINFLQEYER